MTPQRRAGWYAFNPRASFVAVTWGANSPYAMAARYRAGQFAAANGLVIIDEIASYGADDTTSRLRHVAKTCAYAWDGGPGWAWWLVSPDHVRLNVIDGIKAKQRRVWAQEPARMAVPHELPPALEPVTYRKGAV